MINSLFLKKWLFMQTEDYLCPVCAYTELKRPPKDYMICPCCGTEFGYDDFTVTHLELRREWIANGMKWFSNVKQSPKYWNPINQLLKAGFIRSLPTAMKREENASLTLQKMSFDFIPDKIVEVDFKFVYLNNKNIKARKRQPVETLNKELVVL